MSYKKWLCIVCDFIYDEEKGIPDEGIAPGTRWQDIPDDWLCPECGVGKVDFEMVEITRDADQVPAELSNSAASSEIIDQEKSPLVIIGSGLAGYQLAREFRKLDSTTPLTIITSDDGNLYSKPQLSTGFSKNKKPEQLISASAETMATELRADIRIFANVDNIDSQQRCINVDGNKLSYSQLVLATGAQCYKLNTQGNANADIFDVNSLQDYSRFRTALVNRKRVLIVGAGLIGCEYANDLSKSGFKVSVINRDQHILSTLVPKQVATALQSALEQAGVHYYHQATIKSVNRNGASVMAELTDGSKIETDIVLSSIGLTPRTELGLSAGIKVNQGIITNRQLQTSGDNIYALGDCAEVDGRVLCYIAPLMACTKALAKTLAGTPTNVRYDVMPVTIKTSLLPLLVSAPPRNAAGQWRVTGSGNNLSGRFCDDDGKLLGFLLTGELVKQKHLIPEELTPIMSVS